MVDNTLIKWLGIYSFLVFSSIFSGSVLAQEKSYWVGGVGVHGYAVRSRYNFTASNPVANFEISDDFFTTNTGGGASVFVGKAKNDIELKFRFGYQEYGNTTDSVVFQGKVGSSWTYYDYIEQKNAFFIDFMPAYSISRYIQLYGLLGYALTKYELEQRREQAGVTENHYKFNDRKGGVRLGAGVQFFLNDSCSLAVEYIKQTDKKFTFKGVDPVFEFEPETQYLSVSINYHFGQNNLVGESLADKNIAPVLGSSRHHEQKLFSTAQQYREPIRSRHLIL